MMSTMSRSLAAYLTPAVALGCGFWIGYQPTATDSRGQTNVTALTSPNPFLQRMESLPLYNALLRISAASDLHLLCPFDVIPDYLRKRHLLAGTLNGEDKLPTPPLIFVNEKRAELIGFYALGEGLTGHSKTVHGGLLAAIFDEMLAFTAIPQLPGRAFALTSYLTVRYLSRVPTNSLVILHTETVGFRGEYDRKVVLRAVMVDADAPAVPEDFHSTSEEDRLVESFSDFQKRMQKRFPRDKLHCVAEAEFVVPRKYAFWLYWNDRVKSVIPWGQKPDKLDHRYRLPDKIAEMRRNGTITVPQDASHKSN